MFQTCLVIALGVVGLFLSGCQDAQVRVPESAWSPLPSGVQLVMKDEQVLNGRGDEAYLTYLLIEVKDAATAAEAMSMVDHHLGDKGYKIRPAPGGTRWASISGLGPAGTVQVGTADRYLTDPPITEADVPDKFKAKIGDADPTRFLVVVFEP